MKYRWVILGVGMLCYASSQFSRLSYTGIAKFVAADLNLDKAALGLMGAVFFYSYALFQMPWGVMSDKWGSRLAVSLGSILTAGALFGFSTGGTEGELLFWRVANGITGAAVYVAMAGGLARWFSTKERGLSQATFGGAGGALGETTAFFLLPVITIYIASDWRGGTQIIAAAVLVIGILAAILLRSSPPEPVAGAAPVTSRARFEWRLLADPRLWCFAFIYSGSIIAIRIVQPWMPIYAADVFLAREGYELNAAVLGGGTLVVFAYSLFGRGMGCPGAGKLSDMLMKRGVSRTTMNVIWLVVTIALLQFLSLGAPAPALLAVVAFMLGVSVNMFSLVTASISETYGPERTASIMGFINMLAQLLGATGLAVSGYLGISLSAVAGNAIAEYRGIWLAGSAGVAAAMTVGLAAGLFARRSLATQPAASGD